MRKSYSINSNEEKNRLELSEKDTIETPKALLKQTLNLTFCVRDTGIGLTDTQIQQLFQSFQQAENHISRQYGGTGLGLAICKRLVTLMGGEIGVRSDASHHSEFWFRLPLGLCELPRSRLDTSKLNNKTCVIVSDDPYLIYQLQQLLQSWGAEKIQVRSLVRSLSKNILTTPHAALTLIDCPTEQHDIFFSWLTNIYQHNNHPQYTLLLGYAGKLPSRQDLNQIGVTTCLEKPISPLALYENIEQMLKESVIPSAISESRFTLRFDNLNILVAEDNPVNQFVVRGMLSKLGIEPVFAQHGLQAIELFKQPSREFDLIFMDCEMPEMDGFAATEQIRAYEIQCNRKRTPIIALSAHAMDEHIQHCLLVGMDKHISKPVNLDVLKQCLLNYFPTYVTTSDAVKNDSLITTTPT